uniref:Integrin subunit alpha 7 n=1 Tax=Myripristis murdjan TaxID=586833 RepID=A0A667ZLE4_9TELE
MAAPVGHRNTVSLSPCSHRWWISLCAVLTLSSLVCGFNLDTTHTLHKLGDSGTFFGFSLALHQQLTPEPQSWLLVGAPQAAGLGRLKGSRPGALFRCPITPEEYDCERVDIDGEGERADNTLINIIMPFPVFYQTCAHLYELRQRVKQPSETRDPIGRCYVLSEDLTERDDLDGGEWKFCEGRPQGHEQFGFCQQGLSVSFTPDNNFILFGAPGTYNWKGKVMRVQLLNQTLLDLGLYDDGPYEVADQKQLNAQLIPVPYHSYLGFSVDSAMGIMSLGELTFVAGAPRANHTGAVVLLRKDNVYRLVPQHIFWGEELASSFGYSVATTDLNKDGWTDLIVGAPNFFDRKAEIGGAVYVYLNPFGHWDDQARPIRLNGTYDSMFGMTVSNIGDLDQDGYGDIAVGAPFDGDGKVFIYRGSDAGIETKPAQVLDGRDFDVKRFGYSISGGLDIDKNQYPDLAVGSLNDSVVLFSVEVKACFSFKAHPEHYSPHITLMVHFEADTERRKLGLPHRVNFLGRSSLEPEYTQREEVELHEQRRPACTSAVFQLQENIRDKLRPITLAITHTIKPVPPRRHSGAKRLEKLAPILSVSPSNTLHSEVNFLREGCGTDKICQSNLKLTYQFGTRPPTSDLFTPLPKDEDDVQVFSLSDQRSVVLEITVTNMPSDPLYPEEDGDDAHAAQLLISLPNTLSYSGSRTPPQVRCQANQNGSRAECELGNPVKRDAKVRAMKFCQCVCSCLTGDVTLCFCRLARPHQLFFSGAVRGESAMTTLDDIGSPVDFEFAVANTGQALQTPGSTFLNIMWPYELENGKWLLYPANLTFKGHSETVCTGPLNPLKLHHSPSAALIPCPTMLNSLCPFQDCLLGSARCVLFQCPLHSLSDQAVLKIHARLWNSTFIEVREAIIASALHIMLHLFAHYASFQLQSSFYGVNYPLSSLLLSFFLGQCGFFRRAQYKDKVPQYHAVKIPRQDRPQFQTEKSGVIHKKEWATHWSDGTS